MVSIIRRSAVWLLFLLTLVVVFKEAAWANDASMTETASGIAPLFGEDSAIRLAEENLSFDFRPDGYVYVKVHFWLKNESDSAVNSLVGFPDNQATLSAYGKGLVSEYGDGVVEDFRTFLDGQEISLYRRAQNVPYNIVLVDQALKGYHEDGYNPYVEYPYNLGRPFISLLADLQKDIEVIWYCWEMTWQPRQTWQVTNTYKVKRGGSVLGNEFTLYTLITGATWKGPIGRLVIDAYNNSGNNRFVFERDRVTEHEYYTKNFYPYVTLTSDGFVSVGEDHIRLVLEDFEPSSRQLAVLTIATGNEAYFHFLKTGEFDGSGQYILPNSSTTYLTDTEISRLSNWGLTLARNEIYARHRRKFRNRDIRRYFERKPWYAPRFNDVSEMLNAYEEYNAMFIREYQIATYGYTAASGNVIYR